jgi:predicted RNA-binding protein YlxR (DUF448 family)
MNERDGGLPTGATGRRTCLGCGRKLRKDILLRFVGAAGALVTDELQRLPGRGVYCCRQAECLKKFAGRKRRLGMALRQDVTDWRAISALL